MGIRPKDFSFSEAQAVDQLFETIREKASREIWSRGVELARQDAVSGDRRSLEEIVLRVLERGRSVSTLVTLWPNDEDWTKDCACKLDPCHHVTAAVIALKRAEETGQDLPFAKGAGGVLAYAFTRHEGFLHFDRFVVNGEERKQLTMPLLLAQRSSEYAVSPTQDDQTIETSLGNERRGRLSASGMQKLLPELAAVEVTLDGEKIPIQSDPLGISIEIRDEGLGIRVIGKKDPRILETFYNGVVRTAEGLHPQIDLSMDAEDRKILVHGALIPLRELETFASEKLPNWEKRYKVDNRSRNLPKFVEAEAELEILLERHGEQMLVLPGIVYGDPPIARIADGVFRPLGNQVPIRDHDTERRLKDQLYRAFGYELYHAKMLPAADAIRLVEHLGHWKGHVRGDGQHQFRRAGSVTPALSWAQGRLEIEFVGGEGQSASREAVFKAFADRQSLVPLLGGGFAELPKDWWARYGSRIMDLMTAQDLREGLPKAAYTQALDLMEDLGLDAPSDLKIFQRLKDCKWDDLPLNLPSDIQGRVTLRPYQNEGVSWLQQMQSFELGALLADDMGLGKTLQALCSLKTPALIIAPTSVLPNWKREIERFRPALKAHLYHGPNRKWQIDNDLVLTSYGLLRQDLEILNSREWSDIILDEAQTIKNPESKVALSAFQLRSKFRVALSGTPVENRLEDLWSIFNFLNPGLLGQRKDFRDRWAKAIEDGDSEAAGRLRKIIQPFLLRRLKSQVAKDLPPRIEKILYSELWPEERQLYEAIYATTRKEVLAKLKAGGSVFEALEALLRMRQACCHPGLIPSQEAAHSSKLTLLIDTLSVAIAENHKALVFSQWTSLLDKVEPVLEAAGIPFLRIDGSTLNRQGIVDQFQAKDGPPVLLMSLKAGGVGLNLTEADHVFILDPWWNPAAADQAADRAHRIGQTRTVMIHPLVALDTVEEKIMELQLRKRALADASIGEGTATAITRQDIMNLLE